MATVKGRVKASLLHQCANKEPKFGILDPIHGQDGEQQLIIWEGHEGEDGTERGSWDIQDRYLEWLSNCKVLVKWTERTAPCSTKSTLLCVRSVLRFHSPLSLGTKFPDRRKEKKPTQRAA
jgi:hypothetical protein